MKKSVNDFPIPVLSGDTDDFIDCLFASALTIEDEREKIISNLTINLRSSGLRDLIEKGEAEIIVIMESSPTSYRRIITSNKLDIPITISIDKKDIKDKIEIKANLVAKNSSDNYQLPEFNQEYFKGISFRIRKGDILAYGGKHIVKLDSSELEMPISSIFTITNIGQFPNPIIRPEYEDEIIFIGLDDNSFNTYSLLRENKQEVRRFLSGIIVFPVLVEALERMIGEFQKNIAESEEGDSTLDKRWHKAILKKCIEKGIELFDGSGSSVTTASILLGDIANDAMLTLKDTLENEFDGAQFTLGGSD